MNKNNWKNVGIICGVIAVICFLSLSFLWNSDMISDGTGLILLMATLEFYSLTKVCESRWKKLRPFKTEPMALQAAVACYIVINVIIGLAGIFALEGKFNDANVGSFMLVMTVLALSIAGPLFMECEASNNEKD